ncbi:MAG TPA: DUF3175 domain-containing protein, partial [Spirochaetota bacterium]|nr:DUF3175 domain-containing protein [Spirochaetota bacterium]
MKSRSSHKSIRRNHHAGEQRLWSDQVTRNSHALMLKEGVFTWTDPVKIAMSLKNSAEESSSRKSSTFRSAMSMLVFYINRAGRNLPERQLK